MNIRSCNRHIPEKKTEQIKKMGLIEMKKRMIVGMKMTSGPNYRQSLNGGRSDAETRVPTSLTCVAVIGTTVNIHVNVNG